MNQPTNHPPGLAEAPGWLIHPAMLSTTSQIAGFRIVQHLALVHGWSVVGGLPTSVALQRTEDIRGHEAAREHALQSMIHNAAQFGANGIIGLQYAICDGISTCRILVSGTAIFAERESDN